MLNFDGDKVMPLLGLPIPILGVHTVLNFETEKVRPCPNLGVHIVLNFDSDNPWEYT